jgi:hypothetical protein
MTTTLAHYTIKPISKKDIDEKPVLNIPIISDTIKIIDSRQLKDFKDQTFGGYKLSQASAALDKAILEDKIEPALHWTLQLFLSGIISPLWSKFMSIASKSINIYNPKLPEFLYNKTKQWEAIIDNGKFTKDNILLLRNHPNIRLLLSEMVCVLCLSRKRKINQLPRIKKEEFIIDNFKSKLEAKNNEFIADICIDGDPSEIRIAVNEMAIHIYNSKSSKALFWLNWIIEWEKINSKKYGKYECGIRAIEGVDGKYFKDVVWLIWSVINKIRQNKFNNNSLGLICGSLGDIGNQVQYLYKMYISKFSPGARNKKQNLIIWAILYMTETIDNVVALVDRPHILFQSMLGMDKIVMSLKSQEVHHIVNNDLVNVVVENNYMKPETYKELEARQLQEIKDKERQEKELLAKKKNMNVNSMIKLNDMYKLDRMMYS